MADSAKDSKKCNNEASPAVHFLIILFGISAWIGINGIFIQTPVLINTSPESWALPAYLVLVIQTANFGPLVYTILQYFKCKINEPWWILCLLASGTSAMGLLSFFYSERTIIAGNEYSLTLFILTFFNALIGCFSSVLFIPYLRNFHEKTLTSYFIGEGLSGVLTSVVALIQGIEDNSGCVISSNNSDPVPSISSDLKFSSNEYFLFIFVILFLSLTAFAILEYSSFAQSSKQMPESSNVVFNEIQMNVHQGPCSHAQKVKDYSLQRSSYFHKGEEQVTKQLKNYLFTLLAIYCFFSNGFFPSIQTYSCLPYGNIAYKLSITFAQFANPLVCLFTYWWKISNIKIINYMSIVCLIIGSFVTYLALMSPSPPLENTNIGIFLVIMTWTILIGLISFLKLIIVSLFRNTEIPNMLFTAGVTMQIGSATGAIFSFVAINYTGYFKMHNNCTSNQSIIP